jgi:ABC-2 type transport system ATP-binding protein
VSTLELSRLRASGLSGLDAVFGPGCWPLLGAPADGTAALIEILGGWRAPRRGSVRLDGHDPRRSPALRRRIGVLAAEEELPDAPDVARAVARATALRGDRAAPEQVLGAAGLDGWAPRRLASLDPAERRAVALALALSVPAPALLGLHEPLGVRHVDAAWTLERLRTAAQSGAVVVCTTSSREDARRVAPRVLVLASGRLLGGVPAAPAAPAWLRVATAEPRRLAALLADDPAVAATRWDVGEAPGELLIGGADPALLAMAVARAARQGAIPVLALGPAGTAP